MRFLIPAAALALLAAPSLAQTTAPVTTTPLSAPPANSTPAPAAPAAPAPAVAAPSAPAAAAPAPAAPKKMVGHRPTLKQRFDTANTTHDGHLTKDQATAAKWAYITKNFAGMDSAKKGYVTMDDIHAYYRAHHVAKPKQPVAAPAPAAASNS